MRSCDRLQRLRATTSRGRSWRWRKEHLLGDVRRLRRPRWAAATSTPPTRLPARIYRNRFSVAVIGDLACGELLQPSARLTKFNVHPARGNRPEQPTNNPCCSPHSPNSPTSTSAHRPARRRASAVLARNAALASGRMTRSCGRRARRARRPSSTSSGHPPFFDGAAAAASGNPERRAPPVDPRCRLAAGRRAARAAAAADDAQLVRLFEEAYFRRGASSRRARRATVCHLQRRRVPLHDAPSPRTTTRRRRHRRPPWTRAFFRRVQPATTNTGGIRRAAALPPPSSFAGAAAILSPSVGEHSARYGLLLARNSMHVTSRELNSHRLERMVPPGVADAASLRLLLPREALLRSTPCSTGDVAARRLATSAARRRASSLTVVALQLDHVRPPVQWPQEFCRR